jgi:hypothetical protein
MNELSIRRLDLSAIDWPSLDGLADRVVFQTKEWLQFLARTQAAEPVVAEVLRGTERVGYFTGAIIRRYRVPILGSPFPGWTTGGMGFNLVDGVGRRAAVEALVPFAFRDLRCLHLELRDRLLSTADLAGLGFASAPTTLFELDLSGSEEQIFGAMKSACRRAIRKSEKEGVRIEEASGEQFADEYHAQLVDVFTKQGIKPTYGVQRVRELIRVLEPTGHLLLLRAVSPGGDAIATGIFPAMNRTAYFWGGASWRAHQGLRPNEAIFWHAIRFWKQRGIAVLDMGGGGDYKLKYGPRELTVPHFRRSRVPGLGPLRDLAAYVANRPLRAAERSQRDS